MPTAKPSYSAIKIEELVDGGRQLYLHGAGLPKQGAPWGGKMRLVTTWYPGNAAQATQQVIGPQEAPSQWEGEWNTTRLIRSPAMYAENGIGNPIQFADALRDALETILRSGTLLKVSWISNPSRIRNQGIDRGAPDPGDVSIVRIGRASEWNFQYDRIDDIKWTITWEWTSRGDLQQKVATTRNGGSVNYPLEKLQSMGIAITDAAVNPAMFRTNKNIPLSANVHSLDQLAQLATKIKNLTGGVQRKFLQITSRVNDMINLINTAKALPFEIANQGLDVAQAAIITANNFHDAVTRVPPELHSTQQRVSSITRSAGYTTGVVSATVAASETAAAQAGALQSQVQTRHASGDKGKGSPAANRRTLSQNGINTILHTHVVKQGETLLSISQYYFRSIDYAADIAFANGLPLRTAVLPVGMVLVIPQGTGLAAKISNAAKPPIQTSKGNTPLPNGVGLVTGS